ncbi:MAG TPA: fumarylacetoacetate hydrolase family protein [Bryobacteraceae bacterium]|nr:fumarylacetoacetate hydrolase family protein [Bryobacteraceae bacterium]
MGQTIGLCRLSAVYGVVLNFRAEWNRWESRMRSEPYRRPPVAPILYLKPKNTWIANGDPIPLPSGVERVKVSGTLGVVFGRAACRVSANDALAYVDGYTIVHDVSIPHDSYYRPALRERCRDGFCAIGPAVANRDAIPDPNRVEVGVSVNGEVRASVNTAELVRSVERLIADVTEFLTLGPGEILLVGELPDAPLVHAGDRVQTEITGLASLENPVVGP